jgi:hypothetical protein
MDILLVNAAILRHGKLYIYSARSILRVAANLTNRSRIYGPDRWWDVFAVNTHGFYNFIQQRISRVSVDGPHANC